MTLLFLKGLSALASGTFIYVAIVDTLIDEFAVAKDKVSLIERVV
jgi:hypothetical protein